MAGTIRRLSQVYVELPPSRTSHKHIPHVSSDHKENALSRSSPTPMSSSTLPASSAKKRKLDVELPVAEQPATKKLKSPHPKPVVMPQPINATEDYPNGSVYCHQCNKKRDATVTIRCTAKDPKGRRCTAKYCKPCLKNRYGLLLEDILADGETEQDRHVHGEGYHFKCPRCDDVCNCVACRKAKGLQPTGNLANAARQSGVTSAADVLRQDPKAAGPMAHKPGEKKTKSQEVSSKQDGNKSRSVSVKGKAQTTQRTKSQAGSSTKPAPKPKPAPPKPLAKPIWSSVDITLSRSEAEERINIREFALRFSPLLDLSRTHMEELDELRSLRSRNLEEEDERLVPWVSEACVKSLISGLLNILDAKGEREKHLKAAVKSVRESGSHLNKIWAALATLRDRHENSSSSSRASSASFSVSFPDPLPPPESAFIIRTRSGANQSHTGSINVLRTAQLVPVVSALVNAAVESEAIRQEIEAGVQESKERIKEAREAHRIENERYEQEKDREKSRGKRLDKSRTEYHKRLVEAIDDALKVASYAYIPRISPLGRDMEGRTYWALVPGIHEREDALDQLQSYSQGRARKSSRGRRKPVVPSEDERSALRRWCWFVAVWGKRPPAAERTIVHDPDGSEGEEEDDDDEEDGEDEEQWWGFWQPEEVLKLASWVHTKAGLEDMPDHMSTSSAAVASASSTQVSASDVDMEDLTDGEGSDEESETSEMQVSEIPTKGEITSLVKELEQFASLLRCRIRRDDEIEDTPSKTK